MSSLRVFSWSTARFAAVALVALAIVGSLTTPSFAGIFTGFFGGVVNDMHDNDYENAYRLTPGADPTQASSYTLVTGALQQGDLLVAMVNYDEVNTPAIHTVVPPAQLTAISVISLSGGAGTNASPFTFTSASTDAWQALTGTSGEPQGTVAQVYLDNNAANPFSASNNGGPGTTAADVQTDIATATEGSLQWTFGFTGTVNGGNPSDNTNNTVAAKASAGEGWTAIAPGSPGTPPPNNTGTFNGALSQLTGGSGPILAPVGNGYGNLPGQFGGIQTAIQLDGHLTTGGANGSDFLVQSGGEYYIHVTPEPSSLLLMGLGFALAGAGYRRRKA